MKRSTLSLLIVMLALVLILPAAVPAASAADSGRTNRYNVVFVTDASGSMKDTDPGKIRFEAIDLFVGLLANGGNYVGEVRFSNDVHETPLKEMQSKADKKGLTDNLKQQEPSGATDTGSGLLAALNLLESKGNRDLPGIMILLADGETGGSSKQEFNEKAKANQDEATEIARQKGIKIYTIFLNSDGKGNPTDMKRIANATGGEFREVKKAEDLQNVFDVYYQLIFSTQSIELANETVPSSGTFSTDFSMIDLGVEEVNMVLFGSIDECVLTKPDGSRVSEAELDEMTYKGSAFTLLKVTDPVYGNWNLTAKATPGSSVKLIKIYNANMSAEISPVTQKDEYRKDEPIEVVTRVKENNVAVTDPARYQGYTATFKVTDYQGKEIETKAVTEATTDGFRYTFTPKDYGAYYITSTVTSEDLFAETETLVYNIGNTPPTATTDVLEKHVNIWPFLFQTDGSVDLSQAVTDKEDATLTYVVRSSPWLEEDYTLEGSTLTINNFDVTKGIITIEAFDSLGASCTFDVHITSTNIGVIGLIAILAGIVIAVAAVAFTAWSLTRKKFMGKISVENTSPPYTAAERQKSRGKLALSAFPIGQTGLPQDAHFQATGKKSVIFTAKKPFYCDMTGTTQKKIQIPSRNDVRISPSADSDKGIIVRFESMLDSDY